MRSRKQWSIESSGVGKEFAVKNWRSEVLGLLMRKLASLYLKLILPPLQCREEFELTHHLIFFLRKNFLNFKAGYQPFLSPELRAGAKSRSMHILEFATKMPKSEVFGF